MTDKSEETTTKKPSPRARPARPILRLVSREERQPEPTREASHWHQQSRTNCATRADWDKGDDDPGPTAA